MVVRGRTRNAIGPQGRVGSTPTISAIENSVFFLVKVVKSLENVTDFVTKMIQ